MEKFATHLPILKTCVKYFSIKSAIEFGFGLFSSKFLYDNVEKFICIENETSWFDKIPETLSKKDNFVYLLNHNKNIHGKMKQIPNNDLELDNLFNKKLLEYMPVDLVFVDHLIGLRNQCINFFIDHCPYIIFHDSQRNYWDRSNNKYKKFINFDYQKPHTGLIITNLSTIDVNEEELKNLVRTG